MTTLYTLTLTINGEKVQATRTFEEIQKTVSNLFPEDYYEGSMIFDLDDVLDFAEFLEEVLDEELDASIILAEYAE